MSAVPVISKHRCFDRDHRPLGYDAYWFFCPGCNYAHRYLVGAGDGPRWSFNGDMDKPTFTPSLLNQKPNKGERCHLYPRTRKARAVAWWPRWPPATTAGLRSSRSASAPTTTTSAIAAGSSTAPAWTSTCSFVGRTDEDGGHQRGQTLYGLQRSRRKPRASRVFWFPLASLQTVPWHRQGAEVTARDPNLCPVPGCTAIVRSKQLLMCRPHWFSVPKPIRDRVWSTWRAFLRTRRSDDTRGCLDAIKFYKAARNDAIRAASNGSDASDPSDTDGPLTGDLDVGVP